MAPSARPKLAVWKFASCDGCQLSLLDCEDELLNVVESVEIANFAEASRSIVKGPYDVSLVEGSITTPHDAERIHQVRRASKFLITIGACATAGGIQALRNFKDVRDFTSLVYATPQYIQTLNKSTPIVDHVRVDFELHGCPINKHQLLEVLSAFLNRRKPNTPSHSVCTECKRRGDSVRDGRAWHALPGPGHARRLRRYLPLVCSRLLRMLRSYGIAQHGVALQGLGPFGSKTTGAHAGFSQLQRLRGGLSPGE